MGPRTEGPLRSRGSVPAAIAAVVALIAPGCVVDEPGVLDVYAASSLTEAFTEMEAAFEAAHSDTDVRVTFAGSQVLRVQIEQGAGADVFASANPDHVDQLVRSGRVGPPAVFAGNELVLITPASNPSGIERLEDLVRARRLVLGTETVPVGAYARETVQRGSAAFGPDFADRVFERVVSEEPNVRLVRAKVELEEADAAIVYRTDATDSDRVRVIAIPRELNVRAEYVMAPVLGEAETSEAEAWTAFVLSDAGQAILAAHGFVPRSDLDS